MTIKQNQIKSITKTLNCYKIRLNNGYILYTKSISIILNVTTL